MKKLMNERDIKNQVRGLRQRTKTNENEEDFPTGVANSNYDQNMQDLQNEDNRENPSKAIQDIKMQIDQSSEKAGEAGELDMKMDLENEEDF